ncbi:Hypothetical predicted protein [Marmota monax]|uniref:Uncharacterized protein n=1 Tax=Marmota monax TaxID=9995 RepID=A0A5E4D9B2_MARMO|nr:Hypothetical predicted protein [Marmota monax]
MSGAREPLTEQPGPGGHQSPPRGRVACWGGTQEPRGVPAPCRSVAALGQRSWGTGPGGQEEEGARSPGRRRGVKSWAHGSPAVHHPHFTDGATETRAASGDKVTSPVPVHGNEWSAPPSPPALLGCLTQRSRASPSWRPSEPFFSLQADVPSHVLQQRKTDEQSSPAGTTPELGSSGIFMGTEVGPSSCTLPSPL